MAFKFVIFLTLLVAANAGVLPVQQVYHSDSFHNAATYAVAPAYKADVPVTYAHAPAYKATVPVTYSHAPAYRTTVPVTYAHAPAYKAAVPVTYEHAPVAVAHAHPVLAKQDNEYDPNPQYKFGYDIQDSLSGDSKSQVEERDGDAVRGEYSLIDADGFKRIVQYTADPVNGFNAVVNRVPLDHAAIKTVVKSAPLAYAAPAAVVKEYPIHAYHH